MLHVLEEIRRSGESWEQIDRFPRYYISDRGRVYSTISEKVLSPYTNESDVYHVVSLWNDAGRKQRLVHGIVVQHFKPDEYGDGEIHHVNGDHTDNRIENLDVLDEQEHADAHPEPETEESGVFAPTEDAPF